jgi:hypothetical protein
MLCYNISKNYGEACDRPTSIAGVATCAREINSKTSQSHDSYTGFLIDLTVPPSRALQKKPFNDRLMDELELFANARLNALPLEQGDEARG